MAIRIVIVTNDPILKTDIASDLSKSLAFDVRTNAMDIFQASCLLLKNTQNVVLLDTESQRVTDVYLKTLMQQYNVLFIIIGRDNAANFIRSGITNVVAKPMPVNRFSMNVFLHDIRQRIDAYSGAQHPAGVAAGITGGAAIGLSGPPVDARQKIIAITASTGGTEALPVVLRDLPANIAPILIVQHMPQVFTMQFADRLNRLSKIAVKEAASGDLLRKGLALLAPGDYHMKLVKRGSNLAVDCVQTEKVHAVRPAADVTFLSMPQIVGGNVIGVILTGMGSDGTRGLVELHKQGAKVIGQNKESCVVYGMPKAAFDAGAVDFQLPLDKIAEKIVSLL